MLPLVIARYGYAAIFLGTVVEGETVLVIGGFAARRGYLSLPWVMAAAFAGSLAGDQLYFLLARRYGERVLGSRPSWRARLHRVRDLLDRHATLFILTFRFFYGLRTVSPVAIGLTNVSVRRFLLLNVSGAALWSVAFGGAGYAFGAAIEGSLGRIEHDEAIVLAGLAALGAVAWLVRAWRHRSVGPPGPG